MPVKPFQGRSEVPGRRIDVVGEARYQDALSEIAGGKTPDGHEITTNAEIRREAGNRFDANAIQVLIAWRLVGYLSRADAAEYAPVLDAAGIAGMACPAEIRGGWRTSDGDEGHFGVVIWLPEPAKLGERGE